jgi:potassium-transporting ATPase potassium-binding subunit
MNVFDCIQIGVYFGLLTLLTPLMGGYMAKVFQGEPVWLSPLLGKVERWIYRFCGVRQEEEMNWKEYSKSILYLSVLSILVVFSLQLIQRYLPTASPYAGTLSWHSALNTAVSFATNTNWQGYAGETTLTSLVQMAGLTVQNFVSAGVGIAVLIALIRGIKRKNTDWIGNFWVDLTRSVMYVLLPLSIVLAIALVGEGVIQNFNQPLNIETISGTHQVIPSGPVASQIAIKQLGTNGGGFFNANSAHPFENPTPFSNFMEMLAILLIPASLTFTFGKMTGSVRQGWILYTTMLIVLLVGLAVSLYSEYAFAGKLGMLPMEGKEVRFGITNSILWSTTTTAASNGSVNAMLDSLSPLAGLVCFLNIMLGEVIFGGVGSGLYGMLIFVFMTVFIAGLMVGRTPEFSGKKIEAFEIKMSILAIILPSLAILIFSAWASISPLGLREISNPGPHGLSQILYAFTSASGNNGSGFAGLHSDTVFYNLALSICMIIGRFGVMIPVLAIAGSLAKKKSIPPSSGTFRTDNGMFVLMLILVILIIGGLTFFPALSFGPIVEHLLL